jgi:hypothetical protein
MSFRLGAAALAAGISIALSSAASHEVIGRTARTKLGSRTYKGRTITCIRIGNWTRSRSTAAVKLMP